MNALNNFEFFEFFAQHVRKNVLLSVTFIKNLTQDNKWRAIFHTCAKLQGCRITKICGGRRLIHDF